MMAVIFEVFPNADNGLEYLDIAKDLRPILDSIDGFISIERFKSLSDPNKLLSLSFWRDEEAIEEWRQNTRHRAAQAKGRDYIFDHYRIRVASVVRDYGLYERSQAPSSRVD